MPSRKRDIVNKITKYAIVGLALIGTNAATWFLSPNWKAVTASCYSGAELHFSEVDKNFKVCDPSKTVVVLPNGQEIELPKPGIGMTANIDYGLEGAQGRPQTYSIITGNLNTIGLQIDGETYGDKSLFN